MNFAFRLIVNLLIVGLLAFCVFGFAASGEPGVSITWKYFYGTLIVVCVGTLVMVNRNAKTARQRAQPAGAGGLDS